MSDEQKHETIWLQPWCDGCEKHEYGGRRWCQDDAWSKCDECEQASVKYVLAPPPQVDSGREWQPIGTAPRDGTWLLLFNELGNHHIGRFGVRYLGDPGPEAWCCEGKYIAEPTHWMPLPLRPERSGGRGA